LHLERDNDDCDGADQAQDDSDDVHDAIGNDFSAVVIPADLPRTTFR
jgi:hypothetical protein